MCLLLSLVSCVPHAAQGSTSERFPSLMRPLMESDVAISSVELPPDADVVKAAGTRVTTAGLQSGRVMSPSSRFVCGSNTPAVYRICFRIRGLHCRWDSVLMSSTAGPFKGGTNSLCSSWHHSLRLLPARTTRLLIAKTHYSTSMPQDDQLSRLPRWMQPCSKLSRQA
jgi:hypothetical protein